jgi:uncharacterized membrane protein YdjX (TVP38/TMEM64 family)
VYKEQAVLISVFVSIIIAVAGVIPSFFVTGANIAFFGFWQGTAISFVGEVIGANVAFYLYRKGFSKPSRSFLERYPKVKKLVDSEGWEAFYLILLFRVLPFIPSGLVTFAGAIGKVSFMVFIVASALGKIPALLIEAVSVYQILKITWLGEVLIELGLIYMIYSLWKRRKNG